METIVELRHLQIVGAPFTARAVQPTDLSALRAMVRRCSRETLYRRFHGAIGPAVDREMRRVAYSTPAYRSWVVEADDGIRGVATLAWGTDDVPEAAFLVEDAWFRRGVGRALFDALGREAAQRGESLVIARVQADNSRVRDFLTALAPDARSQFDGGEVLVRIPVSRPSRRRNQRAVHQQSIPIRAQAS